MEYVDRKMWRRIKESPWRHNLGSQAQRFTGKGSNSTSNCNFDE
jgi:hypothetical protein